MLRGSPMKAVCVVAAMLSACGFGSRISPELSPKSDKKFFGKDYPDDLRPGVKDHFKYPFPIVQESGDYDKDYVKDENHDSGEWKAQADYDHLRGKLSADKAAIARAKTAEEDHEKELAEAQKKLEEAEAAAKAAQEKADKAEKEAQEAKDDLEKAKGASGDGSNVTEPAANSTTNGTAADNGTANASAEVDKEEMDLEECMRQLGVAQEKVKKLLEKKKEREAEHQAKAAEAAKALAEEAEAAKGEAAEAESLRAAEENHHRSIKSYEDEKASLKKMQEDLEKKAAILRGFRKDSVDQDGGVYHVRSAASSRGIVGVMALALCFLLA